MAKRRWLPLIILNGAIGAYVVALGLWPRALILSALINLVILCVPGLAWLRAACSWAVDRAAAVVLTVALSAAAGALALVVQMLLGIPATPHTHAGLLAVITNVGLLITWGRSWPVAHRPAAALSWRALVPAAGGAYLALFIGATRFVEPLDDQDVEVQGTAFAIVHRGTPMMLHDRRLPYHFPHPHLLHWLTAEALLLTGEIEAVKPYYDAAVQAERWMEEPFRPGAVHEVGRRVKDPLTGETRWAPMAVRVEAVDEDSVVLDHGIPVKEVSGRGTTSTRFPTRAQFLDRILLSAYEGVLARTFDVSPLLWQTRAVNLGLALAALFLFHELAAGLSGSRLVAILVPLAYVSVPEVVGRSCCAGYTTVTVVLLLASAWWYVAPRRGSRPAWPWGVAFLAGVLTALANHKAVVAVGGMVLGGALYHILRRGWRAGLRSALTSPVAWGFLAGTALFWSYGLAVAPEAFILDHVKYHLLHRVAHVDVLRYAGYPAAGELWRRFVLDAGVALPAVAVGAMLWLAAKGKGCASHVLPLILWAVAVGTAFSLTDWRQTKHLMHLMPALVLAPAAAAGASARLGRIAWAGLILVAIAGALFRTADWVARGFPSFVPAGNW